MISASARSSLSPVDTSFLKHAHFSEVDFESKRVQLPKNIQDMLLLQHPIFHVADSDTDEDKSHRVTVKLCQNSLLKVGGWGRSMRIIDDDPRRLRLSRNFAFSVTSIRGRWEQCRFEVMNFFFTREGKGTITMMVTIYKKIRRRRSLSPHYCTAVTISSLFLKRKKNNVASSILISFKFNRRTLLHVKICQEGGFLVVLARARTQAAVSF